ncbi:16S rRNA (guanine(966)-N(2))-methyltransferase RsmD [Gryllotalpicola daejeonensis]|uniref:16S rRNA (Guanine(966)-N(2))-methyltransferase RsmD n=1 Tax=Gryllotalpicola daejeonensis TaxID=993087 RepID=A0ABP7ZHC1_9MICO
MTRIIAGAAGRVTLAVPKAGTRPTSDRVREALFSALEARDALDGARVLDLYAGSGALGLEAASRGAASVVLVEKNAAAARVAKTNAGLVSKAMRTDAGAVGVVASSVASFLASATGPFDLVFSDPPYEVTDADVAADLEALVPLLAPDALVVVERSSRSPEPAWPAALTPAKPKKYGETTIWFAQRA